MTKTAALYPAFFRILSFLFLLLIIIFSLIPLPELPAQAGGDKLHHFMGYAFLMFCFTQWLSSIKKMILWTLILISVGILIEFIQPLVNRYFEYNDMIANSIGILTGLLIGLMIRQFRKLRSAQKALLK